MPRRRRACWPRPGIAGPGGLPALAGSCSTRRTTATGTRCSPPGVPALSVEAATTFGWERYADASVGIDHFGASAPGEVVLREFGFTPTTWPPGRRLLAASTDRTRPYDRRRTPDDPRRRTTDDHTARPLRPSRARARGSTTCGATGSRTARLAGPGRPGHPRASPPTPPSSPRPSAARTPTTSSSRSLIGTRLGGGRLLGHGGRRHHRRPRDPAPRLRRAGGGDGFVSLEVAPSLAHDTDGHHHGRPGPARADRPAQPAGQDPGHRRSASRPSAR